MRALAVNPPKAVVPDNVRFDVWNNATLTDIYHLEPKGTSCIFIDFKLYQSDYSNKTNIYKSTAVQILEDRSK
jgi:hypothetical protein